MGHQHRHVGGMAGALRTIFTNHGIRGLWRGVGGAMMRVSVGSATQLSTFSWTKQHIVMLQVCVLQCLYKRHLMIVILSIFVKHIFAQAADILAWYPTQDPH